MGLAFGSREVATAASPPDLAHGPGFEDSCLAHSCLGKYLLESQDRKRLLPASKNYRVYIKA